MAIADPHEIVGAPVCGPEHITDDFPLVDQLWLGRNVSD
jgi:hypothetical protein